MPRSLTTLALALVLSTSPALAQSPPPKFAADEGRRLRPVSEEVAKSLLREADSLARLTADGQARYENAQARMNWGQYCAASQQLSRNGEFRQAIRAASIALYLGRQSNDQQALAYAKNDLAMAFSFSGQLDLAEAYANAAIKEWNRNEVEGPARKTLGDVAMRRGDPARAIEEYRLAVKASNQSAQKLREVALARAYLAKGDAGKAREVLDDIGSRTLPWVARQVQRARAELALHEKRYDEAVKTFQEIGAEKGVDVAYYRALARQGEASALAAKGDRAGAIAALMEAVKASETVRARFRFEEYATGLFGDLGGVFSSAVSLLVEDGQAERALEVAEAGRSRALLDQVRNRLEGGAGAQLARAESARVPLAELRAALPPEELVVEYFVNEKSTFAWVISREGVRVVRIDLPRDALRADIGRLRAHLAERSPVARELLQKLHAQLIPPLALPAARAVVFVPHDALHHLPFHALLGEGGYLIERMEVSYAPSLGILGSVLARRTQSRAPRLFAIGNPDLGDARLSLPGAEREVNRIKASFPDAQVLLKGEATKPRFLKEAPQHSLVHIAAHAEFDAADPLYSHIKLAGSEDSSGVLEAHEIYRLRLDGTSLMTLSACESGMARVTSGDEIWGFSRAFLSAGVPALVASLWNVSDASTETLMVGFYKGMQGGSPRASLRQAQLAMLKDPAYAHPFYWSPFTLVGDWR